MPTARAGSAELAREARPGARHPGRMVSELQAGVMHYTVAIRPQRNSTTAPIELDDITAAHHCRSLAGPASAVDSGPLR